MQHMLIQEFGPHQEVDGHVERARDTGGVRAKFGRQDVGAAHVREVGLAPLGVLLEDSMGLKKQIEFKLCI